jgi:predicted Zn finger-like uncharacterized protein
MIVACPNCSTKYNLPDDKVPAKGIKVKCSKCGHVFKATPPPATPEEEVEVLLDDSAPEPAPDRSSDFDAAFEEALSGTGPDADEADDADDEGGAAGSDDEDLFGGGFGADSEPDGDPDGDLGGDLDDHQDGEREEEPEDDVFGGGDWGVDDSEGAGRPKVSDSYEDEETHAQEQETEGGFDDDFDDFGLGDEEQDAEDDAEKDAGKRRPAVDSGIFANLDEDLDGGKKKKKRAAAGGRGGAGRLVLTLFLLLVLGLVGAVLTFNLGLWSLPESMRDAGVELPFELPVAVPFVKGPSAPEEQAGPGAASEGDPLERIRKIQPVDFRQYVINNEVEGRVFVVEGQALNNSDTPKGDIRVEVALFDVNGVEIAKQERLCGNTLSLFQLQVDSRQTIDENLNSSRGTGLNNAYIKPGETTPFMFVFFGLEQKVEEYRISITDANDPQN